MSYDIQYLESSDHIKFHLLTFSISFLTLHGNIKKSLDVFCNSICYIQDINKIKGKKGIKSMGQIHIGILEE